MDSFIDSLANYIALSDEQQTFVFHLHGKLVLFAVVHIPYRHAEHVANGVIHMVADKRQGALGRKQAIPARCYFRFHMALGAFHLFVLGATVGKHVNFLVVSLETTLDQPRFHTALEKQPVPGLDSVVPVNLRVVRMFHACSKAKLVGKADDDILARFARTQKRNFRFHATVGRIGFPRKYPVLRYPLATAAKHFLGQKFVGKLFTQD